MTQLSGFFLKSFTGQDKNVDDAVTKAERKANEWLAHTTIVDLISTTTTVATNPNGKHLYIITLAYRSEPEGASTDS